MILRLLLLSLMVQQIVGPPAVIKKNKEKEEKVNHHDRVNEVLEDDQEIDFDFEYKRYLDEVVKVLETDEDFKKKVDALTENDPNVSIGSIAKELEMVNHNVRSKLDELKRQEVQRLRELVKKKEDLGHGPLHPSEYEHLDHFNLETFEVKDLDKLIKKVSKDMDKINEIRKEQFKQYEMEKRFNEELKMSNMTETEQAEYRKHLEEMKQKHANHEKIHHPGSKAQFEEVWEKQDHLENQEFDPKIFFHLHDIDGNGYWDPEEVKALFIKELDKMYQAGLPEDDMKERQEEMERMREHVFKEMDSNKDNLISFKEYIDGTKMSPSFNQDEGWEPLDKQQIYSQNEYELFERHRVAELQKMIDQGLIPPGQYPHLNEIGHHPDQMPYYHPDQMPQGYHPHHPNQLPHHPNQVPQHPNQKPQHVNQNSQHPNQMPQHPNQMPQHPNQIPQHPNQMPQHPNQIPQHPNQQYQQGYQHQQQYQTGDHGNQQQYGNQNHNNQQQYQQQNHHPNDQQYQNQNNQQYHNSQQQQHQNNQQYHQQNHDSQQQQHQNNQQYQQQNHNSQQQQHQNNQQYQQQNHDSQQQQHQNNQQYQQQNHDSQQKNQNNQQYQQRNHDSQQQNKPSG